MEISKNASVLIAGEFMIFKNLKLLLPTPNSHVYVNSLAAKVSSGQQLCCMENHCLKDLGKQKYPWKMQIVW